jgi:hypothetical protein
MENCCTWSQIANNFDIFGKTKIMYVYTRMQVFIRTDVVRTYQDHREKNNYCFVHLLEIRKSLSVYFNTMLRNQPVVENQPTYVPTYVHMYQSTYVHTKVLNTVAWQ